MQAKIVRGEDARVLNVPGVEHRIILSGSETDGAMVLAELRLPAGVGIPRHVHTREEEVFYVIEGQVAFTLGDKETTVGPGTTVFGPRGVLHGFRAAGAAATRMLLTITPAGLEAMFEELSRLPPGAPEMSRVEEIVRRFGISFT